MPWSNHEITQTLHSYFQMLALEINQTPYSKAVYRRALQQRLNDRSESAIEFKHQNIQRYPDQIWPAIHFGIQTPHTLSAKLGTGCFGILGYE
jgi:hypothetical protein